MIGDHGYRGTDEVAVLAEDGTEVITPVNLRRVEKDSPAHRRVRRFLRQRARVEAVIGHLKAEHRLSHNFLHGVLGDEMNGMLAAVGWNLRKLLRLLWRLSQDAISKLGFVFQAA